MKLDLDAVMEAARERGQMTAFMAVTEMILRLARVHRARGFSGSYMDALTAVTAEIQTLVTKAAKAQPTDSVGAVSEPEGRSA